jgi:hypothetical protein
MTRDDLDTMLTAYIECALWSSTVGDPGTPMDEFASPDDLTEACLAAMISDCDGFLSICEERGLDLSDLDAGQVGHDLWLTAQGHGAELGDELTKIARGFSRDLQVSPVGPIEVFETDGPRGDVIAEAGWYWWPCQPGCPPDGDPSGPFDSEDAAYMDALSYSSVQVST